jgi:hypothetical protein
MRLESGGITQVVEHLTSKHEALSSNISTAKRKRKKTVKNVILNLERVG